MKKNIYIPLCLLLSFTLIAAASNDIIQHITKALYNMNKEYPAEKTYIQTDKTYYKPSESIWYKGFLNNGTDNRPSVISDIVYVELHDPAGNIIQRQELNVISGTFNGCFPLSTDQAGGIYKVVAYTAWLKNWGSDFFFTKEITVQKVITPRILLKLDFEKRAYGAADEVVANLKVTDLNNVNTTGSTAKTTVRIGGKEYKTFTNLSEDGEVKIRFSLPKDLNTTDGILQIVVNDKGVEESITRSIPIVINKIQVQFFPEGGYLTNGTPCKIAFEALNEYGKGADITGEIIDESGTVITGFSSYHLGMGAFTIQAEKGKKYFARITVPSGDNSLKELPLPKDNIYTLSLTEKNATNTTWNIYSPVNNGTASIIAHTQGVIQYSKSLNLKEGNNKVEIDTKNFPMGIAVFTLFDDTKAVAERLVFLNTDKRLNIKLSTDKEYYDPEEKVNLSINTSDEKGNPVQANIGLAIVDEQILTMADDKQDNILSYMLLSTELKGKIQEPSFYFNPDEEKAKEAMDYLMLTHGWRRFEWPEILNNTPPFEIKNNAEKQNSIYGYVLNKKGKPVCADVFLIELGGRKRIAKLRTTEQGHFVFHNIDITKGFHVSTKLPNRVYLIDGIPVIASKRGSSPNHADNKENNVFIDINGKPAAAKDSNKPPVQKEEYTVISQNSESDASLSEVVVIGYGTQQKRSLTSAVVTVNTQMLGYTNDLTAALAGSVPGLMVNSENAAPGNSPNIQIRGTSSINTSEPLIILNGIVLEGSASETLSMLNPSEISHIDVLKSHNASAIYGSRASNGVIFITSKTNNTRYRKTVFKPKYSGATVSKRAFYMPPVFFQDKYNPSKDNSTVYWNGNVCTDKNGNAHISFYNNKQSSTFRITAEGAAPSQGLISAATKRIVTQESFSVDAKVPVFIGSKDQVKIPVMMKNNTDKPLSARPHIVIDKREAIEITDSDKMQAIDIPPHTTKTVYIPFLAKASNAEVNLNISAFASESDLEKPKEARSIKRVLNIRDVNFPYSYSHSNRKLSEAIEFDLPNHIPGTLKAEATAYAEVLNELFDGAESIFREPHGCFEQLLSSSFPNVFALQLLKAAGKPDSPSQTRAMRYIKSGYKRLANYEVKQTGGFEWYGGTPAHEMLTAYGLVHFYEMDKVCNIVDKKMTDRAVQFLLSRRNDNGGFKQNRGRYGFSGAPEKVNNAYIVYAFTEIEKGDLIETQYLSALEEALESKDIYRMALLANAAYLRGDMISYKKLVGHFKQAVSTNTISKLKVEATIVRSYGESSNVEAIAYWTLALLKDTTNSEMELVRECLSYIGKKRRNGGFGNTQATSVCLQALTKYALFIGSNEIKGNFCLDVNGSKECIDLKTKVESTSKTSISFADKLRTGKNNLSLSYAGTDVPFNYSVNISWYTATPPTSKLCPLKLTTSLRSNNIKVNETVRLEVSLKNTQNTGQPMSVAIIGIPGGMSLQPWQLKEMQEKEVFDYYEITNDNLVIYYRELGPLEEKNINLDLKAEIPGMYIGTASSAYVYYMNEHKHWLEGIKVNIAE